ncbi:MAG: type IV pilus twitching motility protein PilT [Planctomycetes bacterium]|nr:type IV pilus twitching motility protein PilT [Planctomycetota bacterium]
MEISQVLKFAVEKGASDVLLTVGSPPMVRINGELTPTNAPVLTPEATKKLVYSILEESQVAAFEAKKELDFSLQVKDIHRFRGNVYLQRGCVSAAFRLIPNRIPNLKELGLPPLLDDLALRHQGLILVTGPTGHGKSTTQAAMVDLINQRRKVHIVTVEDPIEFVHTNKKSVIDQREVGEDTHTFADALSHVLRQDPNVILIGEMRDPDTIAAAVTAAETGHLVISTLHTNDAVQAIDRMLDVFPPHQQGQIRTQLALCLLAILAQRLLPRADGKGRVAATELLINNTGVANLIREEKTHNLYTILETHAKDGMYTMDSSIKQLYLKGVITYEEARLRMRDPSALKTA